MRSFTRLALLTIAQAALLAGCSSGGHALNQPRIDQESLFGLAAAWLAQNVELPPGPVLVLDHTDGEILAGPAGYQGQDIASIGPIEGRLTDGAKDAIQDVLGRDRKVEFVASADDALIGTESFDVGGVPHTCLDVRDNGSFVRLASADLTDIHNQVFLVGIAVQDGCTLHRRYLRILWTPDPIAGGAWSVLGADGSSVSP